MHNRRPLVGCNAGNHKIRDVAERVCEIWELEQLIEETQDSARRMQEHKRTTIVQRKKKAKGGREGGRWKQGKQRERRFETIVGLSSRCYARRMIKSLAGACEKEETKEEGAKRRPELALMSDHIRSQRLSSTISGARSVSCSVASMVSRITGNVVSLASAAKTKSRCS